MISMMRNIIDDTAGGINDDDNSDFVETVEDTEVDDNKTGELLT